MKAQPTYLTGQQILEGDSVRIGTQEGVVEHIITEECEGWAEYWEKLGEGVMVIGPAFGRLFTKFDDEDLVFFRRREQ